MDKITDFLSSLNERIGSLVWGMPMIALILLVGIIMSVGTRFFQLTHIFHWLKCSIGSCFGKKSPTRISNEPGQISQFQALCTALASTIGTGNIAGVATAIAMGGPGAVFWMWVSAFFGMMTAYGENVLGIYYRRKDADGRWSGGPMHYIAEGLGRRKGLGTSGKILAVLFCIFCLLASFGMGNMAQVNSISSAMKTSFGMSPAFCGTVLAVVGAFVIVGGISRIGRTTEKLVPAMALFYIVGTLVIFVMNYRQIPYVFSSIFRSAFDWKPILGAGSGIMLKKCITMGFKRGVFSNEAGLGSAVMVHSASNVREPVVQGMWGIFTVFFDTVIVCTLTAFVLLSSSSEAVVLSEALQGITKEPRYVLMCDSDIYDEGTVIPLMDCTPSTPYVPSAHDDANGRQYTVTPKSGIPFDICIKKEPTDSANLTYTNVMSVRGVSVDPGGNPISDPSAPVNAVHFERVEGIPLVTYAFSHKFGAWSGKIIAIAILLFAFSTVIGWSYYGCMAWKYLFGSKSMPIYKILYVVFIAIGATMNLTLVWDLSDTFNGLMALPNLIALLCLSPTIFKITKNYTNRKFKGIKELPKLSAFADIEQMQYRIGERNNSD